MDRIGANAIFIGLLCESCKSCESCLYRFIFSHPLSTDLTRVDPLDPFHLWSIPTPNGKLKG